MVEKAVSDISGISSQRGYTRDTENATVISSDAEQDIAQLASPLTTANLFSQFTPPPTTAKFSGFGMDAFMNGPGQGPGGDDLLPEPPGLGDPFCPTFSIDTPPGSCTPTKRAKGYFPDAAESKADSSFSSSLCGPTPRLIPGAPGPYPGAGMAGQSSEKLGPAKAEADRAEGSAHAGCAGNSRSAESRLGTLS